MAKKDKDDLLKFLSVFPADIQQNALWLRDFVWDLYPQCNELIYDNYNALAFGWSPTLKVSDTFCNIAVGRSSHNIHFGFYWGAKIEDTEKVLVGAGNQYRYILVKNKNDFPKTYIKKLMKNGYEYSMQKLKDNATIENGITVTKSVSQAKRNPPKKKAGK